MIDSAIATSHHFYIIFIKGLPPKSLKKIISSIQVNKDQEIHYIDKEKKQSYTHLQVELERAYGAIGLLNANKSRVINGQQAYWYDFYLGEFQSGNETMYYLAYPYSKIGKFLEARLSKIPDNIVYSKIKLLPVVDYMKKFKNSGKGGILIDIVKYAAEVKEDSNKISIVGRSPLTSNVLKAVESYGLKADPISVKLKFSEELSSFEFAFDRLGNYRFWLKYKGENSTFTTLPKAYEFFKKSNTLEESNYISSYSLLEENEQ